MKVEVTMLQEYAKCLEWAEQELGLVGSEIKKRDIGLYLRILDVSDEVSEAVVSNDVVVFKESLADLRQLFLQAYALCKKESTVV